MRLTGAHAIDGFSVLIALSGLVVLSSCDADPELATTAAVLPRVDTSTFEPPVRRQIETAERAAAAAPSDATAVGRLGMIYEAYGRTEAALARYRRATQLEPATPRWWHARARLESKRGATLAAIASARRAALLAPNELAPRLHLGELLLREERDSEAQEAFRAARAMAPDSPHALAGLAEATERAGDLGAASELYRAALAEAPEYGRAHYRLAQIARRRGHTEATRRHLDGFRAATGTFPFADPFAAEVRALRRDVEELLRRAATRFKRGEYAAALALYGEITRNAPESAMAEYNVALALHRLGRHAEAVTGYESFLERRPQSPDALNNLGLCAVALGKIDAAVARFEAASAADPRYAKAHFNLGALRAEQGQSALALEQLRRALERRPTYHAARLELALLLAETGSREDAQQLALGAVATRPRDERAHRVLRRVLQPLNASSPLEIAPRKFAAYLKARRLDEAAVAVLRRDLAARNDWRTAVALAWILATSAQPQVRRPAEAIALVEPVASGQAANDPIALDTLAAAYAALGRYKDAVQTAERALALAVASDAPAAAARRASAIEARLTAYRNGTSNRVD